MLPGGFLLTARKTYGHVSDGMICAVDELGIGTDHTGILVLAPGSAAPGDDAVALLGLSDEVLDIAVTADMGYCLSVRGLARETAQAFGVAFTDPVALVDPVLAQQRLPRPVRHRALPAVRRGLGDGRRPDAAEPGLDAEPTADVGHALGVAVGRHHQLRDARDRPAAARLRRGPSRRRHRRARGVAGEKLTTLDDVARVLSPEDLVITDDSGVIGLAGVMGGQTTELTATTTNILIEAASFAPVRISRTARRHKLPSEASKRFERWVDPGAAYSAAHRVADLLVELAGGTSARRRPCTGPCRRCRPRRSEARCPAEVLGAPVEAERVVEILRGSGVDVTVVGDSLTCVPPTWRPDLVDPYDYVEEVGNKIGLDSIVPVLPRAEGGRGLTSKQKARRALSAALPAAGFVEVIQFPFMADGDLDKLGVPSDDERRQVVRSRTRSRRRRRTCGRRSFPGLFGAVARNISRGQSDLALYEVGTVFVGPGGPRSDAVGGEAPLRRGPRGALRGAAEAAHARRAVLTGEWLAGRAAGWQQAIAFAETVAQALGYGSSAPPTRTPRTTRAAALACPWAT
jgi:phenylalanyl-tRNA synthetase beta chain